MNVSVTVKLNTTKVLYRANKAVNAFMNAVAEKALEDCNKKAPKKSGALRSSATIKKPRVSTRKIVWSGGSYVGYQWFGMRKKGTHVVKRYSTPGTCAQWAERAAEEHHEEWLQAGVKAFREVME